MTITKYARLLPVLGVLLFVSSTEARATLIFSAVGGSGLSAEAEFTLPGPFTLEVRLRNTSTSAPLDATSADQILTSISWDFGESGGQPKQRIVGGQVEIGPTSQSANFDSGSYGAGFDVSGEYGFGNTAMSGLMTNYLTTLTAGTTPFGGANLDGPASLSGPQGGLISSALAANLGGLGAIQDEIVATLMLDPSLPDLNDLTFLAANGVRVEFGSDYEFVHQSTPLNLTVVPEPSTFLLSAVGLLGVGLYGWRWRRS